jgi:hypothetical protein
MSIALLIRNDAESINHETHELHETKGTEQNDGQAKAHLQ